MIKKTVNIPTSLNDIKLRQWQELQKHMTDETPQPEKDKAVLRVIYGLSETEQRNMTNKDKEALLLSYYKIMDTKTEFIKRFKFDGVEYGFIPDLEAITAGEFIDLEKYLSDKQTFHKALSILYRPIIKKSGAYYNIEKYKHTHEKFKELNMGIIFGAIGFFLSLGVGLLSYIVEYSEMEKPEKIRAQRLLKVLRQNGAGIL